MANGERLGSAIPTQALVNGLGDFRNDTADCILIYLLRVVVMSVLTAVAIHVGTPRLNDLVEAADAAAMAKGPAASRAWSSAMQTTADAVKAYLAQPASSGFMLPPAGSFPTGGRATPDLSALGEGYQVHYSLSVHSLIDQSIFAHYWYSRSFRAERQCQLVERLPPLQHLPAWWPW